jgi:hypothetical protein
MFSVYYTNHFYSAAETFATVEAALEYGKSKGFEFSVRAADGNVVAGYSPLYGLRRY